MLLLSLILVSLLGTSFIFIFYTDNSEVNEYTLISVLIVKLLALFTSLIIWSLFDSSCKYFQFVQEHYTIEPYDFYLGLDGLSIYFVLFTILIVLLIGTIIVKKWYLYKTPRLSFVSHTLGSSVGSGLILGTMVAIIPITRRIIYLTAYTSVVSLVLYPLINDAFFWLEGIVPDLTLNALITIINNLTQNMRDLISLCENGLTSADMQLISNVHAYLTPYLRSIGSFTEFFLKLTAYADILLSEEQAEPIYNAVASYVRISARLLGFYRILENILGIAINDSPIAENVFEAGI